MILFYQKRKLKSTIKQNKNRTNANLTQNDFTRKQLFENVYKSATIRYCELADASHAHPPHCRCSFGPWYTVQDVRANSSLKTSTPPRQSAWPHSLTNGLDDTTRLSFPILRVGTH